MKLKIALCALLLTLMSTTDVSALDNSQDEWTGWGEWECENWGWDREQQYLPGSCDNGGGEPETPTAIPSPTAAIAGLGVMGLMLSRRRNRKA